LKSAKDADAILSKSIETLASMQTIVDAHFQTASMSTIADLYENQLMNQPDALNLSLLSAIKVYRDSLRSFIDDILVLERFVSLHIPAMEDGNNFGVSIQIEIAKLLKETKGDLIKKLEAVPTYLASRAEAVEKLSLPTFIKSETKSMTTSTGGKDGDEKKSSVVSEEKNTGETKASTSHRLKHLVSLDVQLYSNLRIGFMESMNAFLAIVDQMEKNKEKLVAPKGAQGRNSMTMY
jgi:hypothetical protein